MTTKGKTTQGLDNRLPEGENQAPPVRTGFAAAMGIDRGVPIPSTRGAPAHPYPFEKMQVNDSIFIERSENAVNISNIKSAAAKRVPNTKWTTRKVTEPVLDEDGKETGAVRHGFRLWRTA